MQSNNEKYCKNRITLLAAIILCKNHRISFKTHVHTETQNGKESIDSHFLTRMWKVCIFANKGHKMTFIAYLILALAINSGLLNTSVILFI